MLEDGTVVCSCNMLYNFVHEESFANVISILDPISTNILGNTDWKGLGTWRIGSFNTIPKCTTDVGNAICGGPIMCHFLIDAKNPCLEDIVQVSIRCR